MVPVIIKELAVVKVCGLIGLAERNFAVFVDCPANG